MKRFYQKHWFNIPFNSFVSNYTNELPTGEFYSKFYKEFYNKYSSYSQLDQDWLTKKKCTAEWLKQSIAPNSKVLAVGAGIGYIEQHLWKNNSRNITLHVQDFANSASKWLENIMPSENIFYVNLFSEEINNNYDVIYLAGVAYAMEDKDLVLLISRLKSMLNKNGRIILLWGAFYNDEVSLSNSMLLLKEFIKNILSFLRLYKKGQFWGWLRTKNDYVQVMEKVEFSSILDGHIDNIGLDNINESYYIEGKI
jgi:hypothetical protein